MYNVKKDYDFVVVGGGLSGVCAAIAAARHGQKTALIQNRPVLGGNGSSEIGVGIHGAGRHGEIPNLQESGIMNELNQLYKFRSPNHSRKIFDIVLWEKCRFQENLDLYLNTSLLSAETENNKIKSIKAFQYTTETNYEFTAKMFADTTGDATLANESGADWVIGRDAKSTYGESLAPEEANKYTMGTTIMFQTVDMGHKVEFKKPSWAHTFTKEDICKRKMGNHRGGFWWLEVGGDENFAVIEDSEAIRDDLYKWVFAIFDFIKNSGEYDDVDNLAISSMSAIPGRRESRRILGDYVLTQDDCYEGRYFDDAIAYGGWTMDDHSVGGIRAKGEDEEGTIWNPIKEAYTIPYGCIYSRNIENLYVGGRGLSVSHVALSSTRVDKTCAVIGQAIGTAAALALEKGKTCRELNSDIKLLQQTLIKDDCFIPGIKGEDEADIAPKCIVTASSDSDHSPAEKVVNGYDRDIKADRNAWQSNEEDLERWIAFDLPETKAVKEVLIKFDPDLTHIIEHTENMQQELVSDYKVDLFLNGQVVKTKQIKDNIYRLNTVDFGEGVVCDKVKITVQKTYGLSQVRIFEVRIY